MTMWKRFSLIFKAKANKALDKYENPNETLDYSYAKQLELVGKVRTGLADVATSRKRIEMQAQTLDKQAQTLTEQAQKAITMGREDLAREALTRKAALMPQLEDLHTQHASLVAEEEKLTRAKQQLETKVANFRTKKETIKAQYSAAQAQSRINEAVAGIGSEFGEVGLAIQRAEDKTAQMQARASAVDELIASGAFDSAMTLGSGDSISRELAELAASSGVEDELARLKGAQSKELG